MSLATRLQRWAQNRHFRVALGNLVQYVILEKGMPLVEFLSYFLGSHARSIIDDRLCFDEPWLRHYVRSSRGIVMDLGAGEGYFTRKFAQHAQTVYAYEPNPEAFRVLRERTRHWTNVICKNVSLGDQEGEIELFTIPFGWGFSSTVFPSPNSIRVRCITLDSIEIPGKVSTIKIDCEGAEVFILRGGSLFISKHKPNLIIEVHGLKNLGAITVQLHRLKYHGRVLAEIRSQLDRLHRYYLIASPSEVRES